MQCDACESVWISLSRNRNFNLSCIVVTTDTNKSKMNILVIDAETYYNTKTGYTLSKMTTAEYVQHRDFQLIGLAYSLDGVMSPWHPGETGIAVLQAMDMSNTILVAHNAAFDGAIFCWLYGLNPKAVACTMSLARAAGRHLVPKSDVFQPKVKVGGASLGALADAMRASGYAIPAKGDEVIYADGKRLEHFSKYDLDKYGAYCQDDVRICEAIFLALVELLPGSELQFQSHILKCYTMPQLSLDKALLETELVRVLAAKEESLNQVMQLTNVGTRDELVAQLMSNPKFAALLEQLGIEVPMKDSPTAVDADGYPKRTYAFAKTDEALLELAESDDLMVASLVAARLGNKSTIQETRLRRMIGMADQPTLPVQLTLSAAISHRLGGAGACLGADTRVVCYTTAETVIEKRIVDVLITDLVWDGAEFVAHEGVVFNGYKEVTTYEGLTATDDHAVFTCVEPPQTTRFGTARRSGTPIVAAAAPRNWEYHLGRLRKTDT